MSNVYLCICAVAVIIVVFLFILLGVSIWRSCFKYNHSEERLIKSLAAAGFDVRDGETAKLLQSAQTNMTGGHKTHQLTSYQTTPIMATIDSDSFEDIMDDLHERDNSHTTDYQANTLADCIVLPSIESSNARSLTPDEYVLNQARPLTHLDIKHMRVNDYVWLEKTDGVREMYKENGSILDCERYDNKLYCFDALVVNGIDVCNRSYEERMDVIKRANIKDVIVKSYQPVESIDALIEYIHKYFKSPVTGHNIDGVILQERKKTYNSARVYKLKLPIMNTIDFRLKHVGDKDYVLYSGGKFINNSALQFSYPNIDNCSLFVAPYYANSHKFTIKDLPEKNSYPPETAKEIVEMTQRMSNNPSAFDGKIIELSWDGSNYYPIRVRTDKEYPNGYRTAVSNIGLVYAPITIEDMYFENDRANPFSEETIERFHENSHLVRKEIMNRLPELPKEVKRGSCLDLSCGRGGDLKALMDKGYRNLFCVDLDRIALTQLVNLLYNGDYYRHIWINVFDYDLSGELDTLYNRITERKDYSPGHCFQAVFMNFAIHYVIMNVAEIGKFIKRIIKPGGFFAFTFFDGDRILADNELTERADVPSNNDEPINGSTVEEDIDTSDPNDSFNRADGEMNIDESSTEDTLEGGASKRRRNKTKGGAIHARVTKINRNRSRAKLQVESSRSIIMNSAKQYGEFSIEPFKKGDRWYGRFPLPTISSSGYREEPLVLRKELECLGSDYTEYSDLSKDEYFGLLRLRVYKY